MQDGMMWFMGPVCRERHPSPSPHVITGTSVAVAAAASKGDAPHRNVRPLSSFHSVAP
jgi:hypothetical protein